MEVIMIRRKDKKVAMTINEERNPIRKAMKNGNGDVLGVRRKVVKRRESRGR